MSEDVSHLYEDDTPIDAVTYESLAGLAQQQMRLELELAQAEETLRAKKDELEQIAAKVIPDVMNTLGVKKFTFTDGSELVLGDLLGASISKANQPAAYAWLRDHNFGDIIKNVLSVKFPAGAEDEARKVSEAITELGHAAEAKESVHAGTLKSFVREQINQGADIPLNLFSVWSGQRAKIKQPKN